MNVISLIGMPGAGKSTIGPILAKSCLLDFVDTDLLIQTKHSKSLQDIVDTEGHLALRTYEEEILLNADFDGKVVATGGSVVYSKLGMQRLAALGPIVHLDVSLDQLVKRIHNYEQRGIAKKPGQTLESLFDERQTLYKRYADITIDCLNFSPEDCVEAIITQLNQR
jgi:shikimate kinase